MKDSKISVDKFEELLDEFIKLNSTVMAAIDERYKHVVEDVAKMKDIVTQLSVSHSENKHSIAQELIDEGAYDVAKSYIDFLKAKNIDLKSQMLLASHKSSHSVSPVGKKTMKKNNGAEFGPDTKGTKTSGIQEAINKAFQPDDSDEKEGSKNVL
jgi:hypothetical protein